MLKKYVQKYSLMTAIFPAMFALTGCYTGTSLDSPEPSSYEKKIGEMQQGHVIGKYDKETKELKDVWMADQKTYEHYPVKQVDGVWILTPEGLAQRDLDKRALEDKKKAVAAEPDYGGDGGEGGGGGGGD